MAGILLKSYKVKHHTSGTIPVRTDTREIRELFSFPATYSLSRLQFTFYMFLQAAKKQSKASKINAFHSAITFPVDALISFSCEVGWSEVR
jgi:hypothetical protein